MTDQKYSLNMQNITKSFPGVLALNKVNFTTNLGQVSAIVGANGAGKSTLMKVLSGVYGEYEGKIFIGDKLVVMNNPITSKANGIMCVYQEVDTSLIPYLTVAENIMMDNMAMGKKNGIVKWKETNKKCREILDDIGINVNERKLVSELSLSEKQMVLIARAISMDIKYLILDEPTAPLSIKETDKLFELIRKLKQRNVGIIYISHRLNEVLSITDTVTIMKNGEVTANLITKDTNRNEIIHNMLGGSFTTEFPKYDVEIGNEILRVENLNYKDKVKNVSFSLRAGEILGIAGLVGAGKTELSKIIFGAEKLGSGKIFVKGKEVTIKSPVEAVKHKIALVPEERRKEGILVDENVTRNLTIASLDKFAKASFVNSKKEAETAKVMVEDLAVKTPSINQIVMHLSGGNQQKVAVGKWLVNDADVYLFDEATKGVDVGSKTEIFKLVGELAKKGKGIIYLSNELEEIEGISDRALVMYDGEITKEMSRENIKLEKLLFYCTGGKEDEQEKSANLS